MEHSPETVAQDAATAFSNAAAASSAQTTAMYTAPAMDPASLGRQMMAPPAQAPAPFYPQYQALQPQQVTPASEAFAAGVMGLVIVGTGAMGANLHRVNEGEMGLGAALADSVAKGATGAAVAAGATYVSSALTTGGLAGLAVTLAAGTGISYLLTK